MPQMEGEGSGTPQVLIGDWVLGSKIGAGSFAVVWRAKHALTGQLVAIKEISTDKLNKKLKQSLESEVSILKQITHKNIVQLLEVIEVRTQKSTLKLVVVMWLMSSYLAPGTGHVVLACPSLFPASATGRFAAICPAATPVQLLLFNLPEKQKEYLWLPGLCCSLAALYIRRAVWV